MQTIHKIAKVKDNQVIINLPSDFMAREVEVILKPLNNRITSKSELEKEIDIGLNSPISPKSHTEIFNGLRKKYGFG
ncbi:MAG: hypothetical protein GY859_10430 [Desulfobacterales bacterium]|nr:hypothetical protein [Desulfobacterales bacterium]